jgi:cell division protein FtsL
MTLLISALIVSNLITGVALISYMCDAAHDREQAATAKETLRQATTTLDAEWRRLEKELAKHRKLNREIAELGGNRIKDYL